MTNVVKKFILEKMDKKELIKKGCTSFYGDNGRRFDIDFIGGNMLKIESQGKTEKWRSLLGFIELEVA